MNKSALAVSDEAAHKAACAPHFAGGVAERDVGAVVSAYQPANLLKAPNSAGGVAVGDSASVAFAHKPADFVFPAYVACGVAMANAAAV